ncbi:MAG TPA: hypothetical protein VFE62_17295, partial [Gemmataceae bacterium]|nr:hypothetical protein [Gemmataceae bacterium]
MKLLLLNAAALVLSLAMFALWRSGLALMPLGCGITLSALYAVHRRYPNRWTGGLVRLARQIQAWRFGKTCRFIPRCQVPAAGSWRHLFANAFFQLHASDSGVLRILDRDGRPIISALWLYADTSRGKLEMLRCTIEAAPTRDGMRVTVRAASENLSVEMRLSTQHDRAALDWEVDTSFLQDTTVRRIALVAQSAVP